MLCGAVTGRLGIRTAACIGCAPAVTGRDSSFRVALVLGAGPGSDQEGP